MNVGTERKVMQWLQIVTSIPVVGYIYRPVSRIPEAVNAIRYVIFPIIMVGDIRMWERAGYKSLFRSVLWKRTSFKFIKLLLFKLKIGYLIEH